MGITGAGAIGDGEIDAGDGAVDEHAVEQGRAAAGDADGYDLRESGLDGARPVDLEGRAGGLPYDIAGNGDMQGRDEIAVERRGPWGTVEPGQVRCDISGDGAREDGRSYGEAGGGRGRGGSGPGQKPGPDAGGTRSENKGGACAAQRLATKIIPVAVGDGWAESGMMHGLGGAPCRRVMQPDQYNEQYAGNNAPDPAARGSLCCGRADDGAGRDQCVRQTVHRYGGFRLFRKLSRISFRAIRWWMISF